MKKTFIATLLILLIASASIFAITATDNFTVTTNIGEIGLVKVSSAAIAGHTQTAYGNAGDLATYAISSSGNQTGFTAFLTTLSNKRNGYKVTMTATAMKSADTPTTYINYTVGCGGQSILTTDATTPPAVEVMNISSLTTLTGASKAITLDVESTSYAAAVSGSYSGTVTFNYTAN